MTTKVSPEDYVSLVTAKMAGHPRFRAGMMVTLAPREANRAFRLVYDETIPDITRVLAWAEREVLRTVQVG